MFLSDTDEDFTATFRQAVKPVSYTHLNAEDKTILFVFLQYVENQCTFLRVGQSSYSKVGLEYIF